MNTNEIIKKLKELKPIYQKEGFIILGLFGSYARGDYTDKSDIDILYTLDKSFIENSRKVSGWGAINKLVEIKEELKKLFNRDVDLATINGHNKVLEDVVKREAIYV